MSREITSTGFQTTTPMPIICHHETGLSYFVYVLSNIIIALNNYYNALVTKNCGALAFMIHGDMCVKNLYSVGLWRTKAGKNRTVDKYVCSNGLNGTMELILTFKTYHQTTQ